MFYACHVCIYKYTNLKVIWVVEYCKMFFCYYAVNALPICEHFQTHALEHKSVIRHYCEPTLNFARVSVFHAVWKDGLGKSINLSFTFVLLSLKNSWHLEAVFTSDLGSGPNHKLSQHLDAVVYHFKDKRVRGAHKRSSGAWVEFTTRVLLRECLWLQVMLCRGQMPDLRDEWRRCPCISLLHFLFVCVKCVYIM